MSVSNTEEISKKRTVMQIVQAYTSAVADIKDAHEKLSRANETLSDALSGENLYLLSRYRLDNFSDLDCYLIDLDKSVWRKLIEQIEIERFLSSSKQKELEDKIGNGEMGAITYENLMMQMRGAYENIGSMMQESIKEVFEVLRPRNDWYKTNTQFDIGRKVILTGVVEWNGTGWYCYYSRRIIDSIDIAFHNLDNAPIIRPYKTPLLMEVEKSKTGFAETEYFKVKLYKNGNLHLEFKRMDLVKKLNAIAGGNALYEGKSKMRDHER